MSISPEPARIHLEAALEAALGRIPPLWPLRHFVAVNPFVGLSDRPFAAACALLQRTVGGAPVQSPTEYLAAWHRGTISPADLSEAANAYWPEERLLATLVEVAETAGKAPGEPLPTVADWLDRKRPRAHWSLFVVEEISKWCAVHFDENQSTWRSPWGEDNLYRAWRTAVVHDRNPEAFGLTGFRELVQRLPATADPDN